MFSSVIVDIDDKGTGLQQMDLLKEYILVFCFSTQQEKAGLVGGLQSTLDTHLVQSQH